jgi:UDP-N-acetylmuramoyl-L-alanyl-D-glutamate--2,6-diaminopimelate ligase
MKLSEVIDGLEVAEIAGDTGVGVTDLTSDSRKVRPGALFACVEGGRVDGHDYADSAVDRGASVILTARKIETVKPVTQVVVKDVRRALAHTASRLFGMPSEGLTVTGVTGTNGKTTTVHILRAVIEAWGEPAGVMGTLGHSVGDGVTKDAFTTPEAPSVQRYMRAMLDSGKKHCVMEVSSHAISLARADWVSFDVVVFTNLTRDHLDFHKDIDAYRGAKMKLFGIDDEGHHFGSARKAVVNVGDETGRLIRKLTPLPCTTFCLGGDADIRGDIDTLGWEGTKIRVTYAGGSAMIRTPLRGTSNAENALAAFAAARVLGIGDEAILEGLAEVGGVPGRMEVIKGPDRIALVDYAHTPDALERLLTDVRQMASAKVICVFGCGGDRDRGKRPEMGAIASRLADLTIVTSDNPRTEDPTSIIEDILRGVARESRYEVVPDRAEAIQRAVRSSSKGDIIVVAGKGHEDYQIIGTETIGFDDREVVRKALGIIANAKA